MENPNKILYNGEVYLRADSSDEPKADEPKSDKEAKIAEIEKLFSELINAIKEVAKD